MLENNFLHGIYNTAIDAWGWFSGSPRFRRLNNLLVNLGTRGLGIGNCDSRHNGEARALGAWIKRYQYAPVIWDVGANQGGYTQLVRIVRPDARVWAFEPNRASFERLRERFDGSGVRCLPCAIGRQGGRLDLWDYNTVPEGSEHATFYPDAVRRATGAELTSRSVPVRTIDEVARAERVDKIDLLKLDVEGHELACLEGAAGMIANHNVAAVQFEFNSMHLDARVHMGDFADLLPYFTLYRILPRGLLRLLPKHGMLNNIYHVQNIFAIHQSHDRGQA